ncbi:MAG TPA: conjugal transfer protein TraB, partial [Chryseobacterium sp.]|nr:conjugal transfer protein TraB [Chryseobacterium sp.]
EEQEKEEIQNEVRQDELPQSKPVQRERNRTKKSLDGSYGEHFLKTHSMTKRGDKSIYIRQEYHERLSRIVQVIGKDAIPLYAYLDNILEHHFEMFEKAITDDFNEKFKPIF